MIYIHVPYCHRKCTYCAFFSKVESGKWRVESYVDALIEEIRLRRDEQAHPIRTVYFGGGTPSILAISDLERIDKALRDYFNLTQVEEVTMECNPEDLTDDYIHGIKQLGLINRLSIGIQSLDDDTLRLLNRRHTAAQALAAVEKAHAAGFGNIAVDFIYGIKDHEDFEDLKGFRDLKDCVTHISAYALTVEPGTALAVQVEQGRFVLPDEDEVVRQYHALRQQFESMGFSQYEVSNFARPGFESRHNSRYWDRTPYLGLGPGAHSFDGRHRRWNYADLERYCNILEDIKDLEVLCQEETLTEADAFNELLMTALRTTRGLRVCDVPEGQRERLHRKMQPYIECGWIVVGSDAGGRRYVPTAEGLLHADGMAAALFVE